MAVVDLSSLSIQLLSTSGATSVETAGESLESCDALYRATSGSYGTIGTVMKLQNDSTEEEATFYGFALNDCKSGGQVTVLKSGAFEFDTGTPFTAGESYYASGTAGDMEPQADLASADHVCLVGFAKNTEQFYIVGEYIGLHA